MGNSISSKSNIDPEGPGENVLFFRNMNVKWLNVFVSKIKGIKQNLQFTIDDNDEKLQWTEYFQSFTDIKESINSEAFVKQKNNWHPATLGYAMVKELVHEEYIESPEILEEVLPPDGYTEDTPSDLGNENDDTSENNDNDDNEYTNMDRKNNSESQRSKSNLPKKISHKKSSENWSPIYFGYSIQSEKEQNRQIEEDKLNLITRENRAISKAKSKRGAVIDVLEKTTIAQAKVRIDKIEKVESKYKENKLKREKELEQNQRELLAVAFALYEVEWETQNAAAELAYHTEIDEMKRIHEEKSAADIENLRKRREDMEAFKEADRQEVPCAERLEDFARIEVSRSIEELEKLGIEMDKMRLEYREMKTDFDAFLAVLEQQGERAKTDKNNQRKLQEMKSMVSLAETRMKEAQRCVKDELEGLIDAELLLNRAVRMRNQQDELLPLFSLIAGSDVIMPSNCELNALIISMIVLMEGTFDQKYNFLFRLYDSQCEGTAKLSFAVNLLSSVQHALSLLKMLKNTATHEEIVNMVIRAFMSFGLNPSKDHLTEYELKTFVLNLASHSYLLTSALGVSERSVMQPGNITFEGGHSSHMGTYQRNLMSPIALISRGMINLSMCKIRLHNDNLRYKAALHPLKKQQIHERALRMGQDDPLRNDYTKFFVKETKAVTYRILPLDHGHLMNIKFIEDRAKYYAAIKIQALFRSVNDRKKAELAARYQAFQEAKVAAMKEMKSKVIKEFKKREAGKGMGKMKWDAEVRIRQAKLRTLGQVVSRSDTVMMMMEEAISLAKEDIELRFKSLEEKEEFSSFNFDRVMIIDDPAKSKLDVTKLFGLILKPSIADQAVVSEDNPPSKNLTNEEYDNTTGNQEEKSLSDDKDNIVQANDTSFVTMDQHKVRNYVQGKQSTPPTPKYSPSSEVMIKGETEMEVELRLKMASPEASLPEYFFNRLRALNIALTKFKTEEITNEIPSKRLLLLYIMKNTDAFLKEELTKHFKFKKQQKQIIKHFRNLVKTDLEMGTIRSHLFSIQKISESSILTLFDRHMNSFIMNFSAMIELRLQTNSKLKENDIIQDELNRLELLTKRFKSQCLDLLSEINSSKAKFSKIMISHFEVEKKLSCIKHFQASRDGSLDLNVKNVPLELRHNWILRLSQAIKENETNVDLKKMKYAEISNVCREFINIATSDARIIINEIYQPKYLKTIQVTSEHTVDGRSSECGRGLENGIWYSYEAHNICYHVCLDYDGVFNGSDENAVKAAGCERLGAQEYFKLQIPRLQCPIVVTIDYQGFRILAKSKLPLQTITFNDDGEIRKVSEELLYGIQSHGETFVNKSKTVQSNLKLAAGKLNLVEHLCKGSKDISSSTTYCSSEIKIYKGQSDEFYLNDFWRSFPSEIPTATPHLRIVPRYQSTFWRFLRPEYVRNYRDALSPDACSTVVYRAADSQEHYDHLVVATNNLIQKTIPNFMNALLQREYMLPVSEGFGIDLASELHTQGINLRHLGLMRSLLWRDVPGTISFYHHNDFVRTSQDLRQELSHGDRIKINGQFYTIEETHSRRISHNFVPISTMYMGESFNALTMRAGKAVTETNCIEWRQLLLAEMIARTTKNIIRFQMRVYNMQYKCTSTSFYCSLVCEYLNAITGGSPNADELFQQTVIDSVRERFGECAILPSEKSTILLDIQPVLSFLVTRITSLLGLKLCISCESEFHERPIGFLFTMSDILEVFPIVKHNISILPLADAILLSMNAAEVEQELYIDQVLRDEPAIFYTLAERKGSRQASNKGYLGSEFDGILKKGCELEYPGPILSNKFIRSVSFRPNAKSYLDIKYHVDVVPLHLHDHFSIEIYYQCTGGKDTVRVIAMCGRYQIEISRDNHLVVIFMDSIHDVILKLCRVEYNKWVHLFVTYDETTLRCYLNGVLSKQIEIEGVLQYKTNTYNQKIKELREELNYAHKIEINEVKEKSHQESLVFFQSKEGVATLKRMTREIMESDAFQAENIAANAKDQHSAMKEKRSEGLKRAKVQYIKEHYEKSVNSIDERYKDLNQEMEEKFAKEIADGDSRVLQPLRIGAASPNSKTVDASYVFYGQISCVSVYSACLPSDRVKDHYMCSIIDRRRDAQRMYAIASSKFELALKQGGPPAESSNILNGYAKSLCSYLRMESSETINRGKLIGKLQILDVIQKFKGLSLGDGIAEILREVPKEPEYADIIVQGFLSIQSIDKNFFSKSFSLQRKDLVHYPFDFALVTPESSSIQWEVAAYIFREVIRDVDLMYIYGELNLRFLSDIKSAPLIISLVKAAMDDKNLKIIKFSEIFNDAGLEDLAVEDDDVQVITQSLPISEGIDLTNCKLLTDTSLLHIDHMNNIKLLNLSYCSLVTDNGLKVIRSLYGKLQTFSIEGLTLISDDGLQPLINKCSNLRHLNINKCPNISCEALTMLVTRNRYLNTILLSEISVDDESFVKFCAVMLEGGCASQITHMDISYCRELSDIGIICLSETCVNLKRLNLCGLNKISDLGVNAVCANCWYLEDLNVEDIFLLRDDAFWFNPTNDGRRAANENMLTSLKVLNFTDCSNLSDHGIAGLAERCRQLHNLNLRGCDKITDSALQIMADMSTCTATSLPMCDSFQTLVLSYCTQLTSIGIITLLPLCACLENLDLSGLSAIVTDSFMHQLSLSCKTLQKLTIAKCLLITDATLCSIADNLWLEYLDITGCNKCTDAGIEVFTEACSGLRILIVKNVKRITNKSIFALIRNCAGIQKVNIQDCPLITYECISEVKTQKMNLKIVFK